MAVAATGFFDGVHLGHRKVIEKMCAVARERGEESMVVTFWPHPRSVLQQDADRLRLLTSLQEKRRICLGIGVDRFEVLPFSRSFSELSAGRFIREYLVEKLGVTTLILGYDHRLGHDSFDSTEQMIIDYNGALEYHCQGAQVVVVTVDYLDGMYSDAYAYQLFNDWGVGSSEYNNGMLLLLAVQENKAWLAYGLGLTSVIDSNDVLFVVGFRVLCHSANAEKSTEDCE